MPSRPAPAPARASGPVARLPEAVQRDVDELGGPTPDPAPFDPAAVQHLPAPARRWLTRAIAPGTPLRRRVRLVQHGAIRLGAWRRFRAVQVIAGLEGYVWACSTRVAGVPVHGYDRLAHGRADMVHRAFGRVALVDESGPDLARSATGRLVSELVWTPAAALDPGVSWEPLDDARATALVPCGGETHAVTITVDPAGAVQRVTTPRWARDGRGPYRLRPFGAEVHAAAAVGGFTVPTRVTAGYDWDGPDWPGCAFIRIAVDEVDVR